MSDNEDDKKETPDPDSESITGEEIEKLEEAAEAGDIEAQKKLAELEGVENYEEYKQLGPQVIFTIEKDTNSESSSVLRSLADVFADNSILEGRSEMLAGAGISQSELDNMGRIITDAFGSTFDDILARAGISKSDLEKMGDTLMSADKLQPYKEDLKKIIDVRTTKWTNKLNRIFVESEGPRNLPDHVSGAFLTRYYPGPQEQLRDEMVKNNLLLEENNRLQRELIDKNRKLRDATRTTKPQKSRKSKNKLPNLPTRKADAYKWVLAWELIAPKIDDDPTLNIAIDELIQYLKLNNLVIREDTLRKIITRGKAGKIPTRLEFERKNQM